MACAAGGSVADVARAGAASADGDGADDGVGAGDGVGVGAGDAEGEALGEGDGWATGEGDPVGEGELLGDGPGIPTRPLAVTDRPATSAASDAVVAPDGELLSGAQDPELRAGLGDPLGDRDRNPA